MHAIYSWGYRTFQQIMKHLLPSRHIAYSKATLERWSTANTSLAVYETIYSTCWHSFSTTLECQRFSLWVNLYYTFIIEVIIFQITLIIYSSNTLSHSLSTMLIKNPTLGAVKRVDGAVVKLELALLGLLGGGDDSRGRYWVINILCIISFY